VARPQPDPRAVVAVFEAKKFVGLRYTEIVEWTEGKRPERELDGLLPEWEWDPISRGSAFAWYRQALQWWLEHERLNPDEEYAGLRIGLEYVAEEVVREYRAGRADLKTFAELTLKVSAEIRSLTQAGRAVVDPGEGAAPPPQAQAAIIEMRERQSDRDRARARVRKALS
jgi:hypothetical protein